MGCKRYSTDKRHGQEVGAIDYTEVVDGANIGVLESCCRLSLAEKSSGCHLDIAAELWDLEGYGPIQCRVVGQVNGPHPAFAENTLDSVTPKSSSGPEFRTV